MRSLLILRHAKAAYLDTQFEDFDRPLTLLGKKHLSVLAEKIQDSALPAPDIVVCSSARRARETLESLLKFLPTFAHVEYDEDLYLASLHMIYTKIISIGNQFSCALMVGHNPGLEQLLVSLAPDDSSLRYVSPLAPACLVHLELKVDHWCDVQEKTGSIKTFLPSEDLQ